MQQLPVSTPMRMLSLLHAFFADTAETCGWPCVVFDGGSATELERRGHVLSTDLWSAACVHDARGRTDIQRVHEAYLEAGSDIITTCSYQASVPGFERVLGVSPHVATRYIRNLVELAVHARDDFWQRVMHEREAQTHLAADEHTAVRHRRRPLVAVSVGCFGACLARGQEYTGDYGVDNPIEHVRAFQLARIRELARVPGADLLVLETLPNGAEIDALLPELAHACPLPVMLSFSCRPHSLLLRDGTPIARIARDVLRCQWRRCERAVAAAAAAAAAGEEDEEFGVNQIVAIGVNCVRPDDVVPLLHELQRAMCAAMRELEDEAAAAATTPDRDRDRSSRSRVQWLREWPWQRGSGGDGASIEHSSDSSSAVDDAASPMRVLVPQLLVYPNSGEVYDVNTRCWRPEEIDAASPSSSTSSSPTSSILLRWGDRTSTWYEAGARLIGGCCRTTPDHIRETRAVLMSQALSQHPHVTPHLSRAHLASTNSATAATSATTASTAASL